LEKEVSVTDGRIAQLKSDLNSFVNESGAKRASIDAIVKKIKEAQLKVAKIDEEAAHIEKTINLRGGTLINCLLTSRKFLKSNQNQTLIMQPLINLLGNVQEVFTYHMELLKTGKRSLVYIAGEGMLKELGLLQSCSNSLHEISIKTLEGRSPQLIEFTKGNQKEHTITN